jgi:hypothetical protein
LEYSSGAEIVLPIATLVAGYSVAIGNTISSFCTLNCSCLLYTEAAIEDAAKAKEIFAQLPPLNQKLIIYLIDFLKDLAQPQYIEVTKMGKDNLCMVFAPSFLRCPFTDPQKMVCYTALSNANFYIRCPLQKKKKSL